ncbi:MAG: DUF3488 and transglutaminase-like domain-containing protein [Desulfobacterales bacterium]|jgi:transglutaminase-like putative cysteine protease
MVTSKNIALLLAALGIALIPQIPRLPLWVVIWCVLSWSYILAAAKYGFPRPIRSVRLIFTIGGVCIVLLSSGFSLDKNSSLALLWIMASIKPMEICSYRDEMVTIFLTYFLGVASLFFTSGLFGALYMALSICVTTVALIHIHHPQGKIKAKLALSVSLMLKALPLTVILFIALPRVQGSLWGIQSPADAVVGFTERLSPGSVVRLVRSNDIAFRVEFQDGIPRSDQLYWRGLVFWYFDGRVWQGRNNTLKIKLPIQGRNTLDYTITLEPHNSRWLFALDLPYESDPRSLILSDYTLTSRWNVRRRLQYRVKSLTSYNTGQLWKWEAFGIQLPQDTNPDAASLARKWRSGFQRPEHIIDAALRFFKENKFAYTLNPPALGAQSIDDFLFRTRKGYCEHYASAFAFLMRAANIPARIVAGYLGGELNPYGNYLLVRQADAHVWVEVWLSGKGWVRVDPTSVVAPERIERGTAAALPPDEREVIKAFAEFGPFSKYWINLRLGWDAIHNQWNRWVLGFSNYKQKRFFNKIGVDAETRSGFVKVGSLSLTLLGFITLMYFKGIFKRSKTKADSLQQAYLDFCEKLERIGLVRLPYQGPIDYVNMVLEVRHDLKRRVLEIIHLYVRLRYANRGSREDLKTLKKLVKQFKP